LLKTQSNTSNHSYDLCQCTDRQDIFICPQLFFIVTYFDEIVNYYLSESDCCLTSTQQFFSYIMARTVNFHEMMMMSALY